MRALRFGSYSIAATFAGTPSLFRLKSTRRYRCLWPPPRWRDGHAAVGVAAARLRLRLRQRLLGLRLRDLGEVGGRLESAPRARRLAFADRHRQLPKMSMRSSPAARVTMARLLVARGRPRAGVRLRLRLPLRLTVSHRGDLRAEQLLDGFADLDLVGVGRDDERVDVHVVGGVRLLRHHRLDDDVAGIFHRRLRLGVVARRARRRRRRSRATVASSDAFENTSQSLRSTS